MVFASPLQLPLASQAQRSGIAPLLLLPSVAITGMAHLGGGIPYLSDMGMLWLTVCCGVFLVSEIWHFKTRQGWGASVLWFGILIWLCHDYMTHWFQCNWSEWPVEYMPTVGKMAFLHCLFITFMAWGMNLNVRDGAVRAILRYPEPNSYEFLFWIAIITFALNIGYELAFSYADLIPTLKSRYFGGRRGQIGTSLGTLGAINTSFSAYITMFSGSVGIGSIAGIAYALFVPTSFWKKWLMIAVWFHVLLLGFGGGTRTALLAAVGPMVAFLVIKSLKEPPFFKKILPVMVAGSACIFVMIQIQTHYRMDVQGFSFQEMKDKNDMSKIQGNTMFSEALDDYARFPEQKEFFYDNAYPGEGVIRALPEMAFWCFIAPVPRPLLTLMGMEKPLDPAWSWRARAGDQSGATDVINGTTCSYGMVGAWYFRFGPLGMLEGALLMGWAYAWVERIIRSAVIQMRLMSLVIGLLLLSTLFFFFRDIVFPAIWAPILILVALAFILKKFVPHH